MAGIQDIANIQGTPLEAYLKANPALAQQYAPIINKIAGLSATKQAAENTTSRIGAQMARKRFAGAGGQATLDAELAKLQQDPALYAAYQQSGKRTGFGEALIRDWVPMLTAAATAYGAANLMGGGGLFGGGTGGAGAWDAAASGLPPEFAASAMGQPVAGASGGFLGSGAGLGGAAGTGGSVAMNTIGSSGFNIPTPATDAGLAGIPLGNTAGASVLGNTANVALPALNTAGGIAGTVMAPAAAGGAASTLGSTALQAAGGQVAQQVLGGATSGTAPTWLDYLTSGLGLVSGVSQAFGGSGQMDANALRNMVDPFAPYRAKYAGELNTMMANPSSVTTLPGYQFLQDQGQQSVMRQLAAQGRTVSGAEQLALQKQGEGLANQFYNEQFNKLATLSGATANPSAGGTAYSNALTANQQTQQGGLDAIAQAAGAFRTMQQPAVQQQPQPFR